MKTFHEIVDEIYYKVDHLEPWERGTRKTAGMSELSLVLIFYIYFQLSIYGIALTDFILIKRIDLIHVFNSY